jgi:putative transferase (TIGR04331 family)
MRLALKLRLVPRLYLTEFPPLETVPSWLGRPAGHERARIRVALEPANDFERYLLAYLPTDLPSGVVEHQRALAARSRALGLKPKVVVSALGHWTSALGKAWMAEAVESGARLLALSHGGSLPPLREFFDFDEAVGDVRGTWFKPHRKSQVQVPPSKLVGLKPLGPARDGAYCLIVGNEYPRWAIRVHFAPMADQCLRSHELVTSLVERLRGPLRQAVRIRPAPDSGWKTAKSFERRFGESALLRGGSLYEAFGAARVIVCTYPETTFAEAMATERPTILLYPEEIYERNAVAAPLIAQLRSARILVHDAQAAAAQLEAVWDDVDAWWSSSGVVDARKAFVETALRLDGDWLETWSRFLSGWIEAPRAQADRA